MKRELADYKIVPKVVKADEETVIKIIPRGAHAKFDDSKEYLIRFVHMEQSIEPLSDEYYKNTLVKPQNGVITIKHTFPKEQMHLLRVILDGRRLFDFSIYSLYEDLYNKRPYKGDFHVHSYYSDGKEEPSVVVANYRKAGFDFLAITDHERWYPSKEAIEKYENVPVDISLFLGEEVHVPHNYIHAINFGGNFSVNELYKQNKEKCDEEVEEIRSNLKDLPEGVDSLDYARRFWIAKKVKEGNGIPIFVHPHWINNAYNVPDKVSEYIFEQGIYDAFELIGGQSIYENNTQLAMYHEQRAKGVNIPIVGSSDSHGTEYSNLNCFKCMYTIAFCDEMDLDNIKQAIKQDYTVAIEHNQLESPRAHGKYRMVKFGMFLVNEFYPLYEELCFEEGRAMKDYMTGNDDALEILKITKGRTEKFYKEFYGKN